MYLRTMSALRARWAQLFVRIGDLDAIQPIAALPLADSGPPLARVAQQARQHLVASRPRRRAGAAALVTAAEGGAG